MTGEVGVIGAGSSGSAAVKALRELGVALECFERGPGVGGLWRYENDIARDLKHVIKGLDTRYANEAADRLGKFDKRALVAWSREDRFFKPAHAQRLAQDLPKARLEWIENARSLSPEDQPARLAELIADFVREPAAPTSATPASHRAPRREAT